MKREVPSSSFPPPKMVFEDSGSSTRLHEAEGRLALQPDSAERYRAF
jgi:hypothetical protein